MCGINSISNKVSLDDLKITPKVINTIEPTPVDNTKVVQSLNIDEKVDIKENSKIGSAISSLSLDENIEVKSENKLPPVNIRQDGKFEFSSNAYGRNMSSLQMSPTQKTTSTVSGKGLSIILKQNSDKRDVLVFSNMSDKIPNNSNIPNHYFHIDGKGKSKMYFDDSHNIVIELKNKEKIVIDGKDGQTFLEGPFKLDFDPNARGSKFNVTHTGSNLPNFKSLGDKIKW